MTSKPPADDPARFYEAAARAKASARTQPSADEAAQTHADIEACDRALHELVTAIIAYDTVTASVAPTGKAIKLRWAGETDLDRLAFEAVTTHPVRYALREGVKRIGREIHRLGGGAGSMMDSLDKVAEMDPAHAGRRGSIINAAWNGVGAGDDRWWS